MIHFHHSVTTLKDIATIASIVAQVGAVIVAIVAVRTWQQANAARAVDESWNRVKHGITLWDQIVADPKCVAALHMLEGTPRLYTIDGTVRESVTRDLVVAALTKATMVPSPVHYFIRDSFDSLFFRLGHFEQYLDSGLVEDKDIEDITDFYVARMADDKPVYTAYLRDVCRNRVVFRLLGRFPVWYNANPQTEPTPRQQPTGALRRLLRKLRGP